MQNYAGKTIEGVYACYAITPKSALILRKISEEIMHVMNEIPQEQKPKMEISSYHMTIEYKGNVSDILSYVEDVRTRKLPGGTLDLALLGCRQSFVDGAIIPHLSLKGVTIPFHTSKQLSPHVTLLEIENNEAKDFFLRFILNLDRFGEIWQETCRNLPAGEALEVDTSKIQIRGKVDGEKTLIVEV